jgi:hypothetical protein
MDGPWSGLFARALPALLNRTYLWFVMFNVPKNYLWSCKESAYSISMSNIDSLHVNCSISARLILTCNVYARKLFPLFVSLDLILFSHRTWNLRYSVLLCECHGHSELSDLCWFILECSQALEADDKVLTLEVEADGKVLTLERNKMWIGN